MVPKTCSIPECEKTLGSHGARGWCGTHYRRWQRHGSANATSRIVGDDIARFWGHVEKTSTCWNWAASTDSQSGYGEFRLNGKTVAAHRVSYVWSKGQVEEGLEIDHRCHNRACVNPEHLRPVTRKQNRENLRGPQANSTSGVLGVSWQSDRGKWRAKVGHQGRQINVGSFDDLADAEAAVIAKRNELFTHNDRDRIAL